jgi:hypothetical protein
MTAPEPVLTDLPPLRVKGRTRLPIVQGGMGVGVSAHRLAGTVARLNAVGTIAAVDLRRHHADLIAATGTARDKGAIRRANLVALDREIRGARGSGPTTGRDGVDSGCVTQCSRRQRRRLAPQLPGEGAHGSRADLERDRLDRLRERRVPPGRGEPGRGGAHLARPGRPRRVDGGRRRWRRAARRPEGIGHRRERRQCPGSHRRVRS